MIDDKQLISALLATRRIGQPLLKKGLELADKHQATLYHTLIAYDLVAEHTVVEAASEILNVPCVHLSEHDLDPQVGQMIPHELATSSQTLPLAVRHEGDQQILKLAMADPIDVMAMDEIASYTGIDIHPVLVGPNDLQSAIDRVYDDPDEEIIELDELEAIPIEEEFDEEDDDFQMHDSIDFSSPDDEQDGGLFGLHEDSAPDDGPIDFSAIADQEGSDEEPSGEIDAYELDDDPGPGDSDGLGDDDSWATMFNSASEDSEAETQREEKDKLTFDAIGDGDIGGTQIGRPAQLGEWSESDLAPNESWETSDAFIEEVTDEEQAEDEAIEIDADPTHQSPGRAPQGTPVGLASRPGVSPKELSSPPDDRDDESAGSSDGDDSGDAVPKSIRDVLNKTRAKNKKKTRSPFRTAEKESKSSDPPREEDNDKDNDNDATAKAALGRIDVKRVAVPSFKGAVEKRSDRGSQQRQDPPTESPTLPEEVDSDILLRALIDLLIDKEVISRRELTALLQELA